MEYVIKKITEPQQYNNCITLYLKTNDGKIVQKPILAQEFKNYKVGDKIYLNEQYNFIKKEKKDVSNKNTIKTEK